MRVGGRIGRLVVRAEVCFSLDDAARENGASCAVYEDFAEEARGDKIGRMLVEAAWKRSCVFPSFSQATREGWGTEGILRGHDYALCSFFHSLSSASTSSACPSGFTSRKI